MKFDLQPGESVDVMIVDQAAAADFYEQAIKATGRVVEELVRVLGPDDQGVVEVLYFGTLNRPMTAVFDAGALAPAHVREGW